MMCRHEFEGENDFELYKCERKRDERGPSVESVHQFDRAQICLWFILQIFSNFFLKRGSDSVKNERNDKKQISKKHTCLFFFFNIGIFVVNKQRYSDCDEND